MRTTSGWWKRSRSASTRPSPTRLRDEEQSFNLIETAPDAVKVAVQAWDGCGFASRDATRFVRREGHWATAQGEELAEAVT